jgi:hypothetical protein
VDWDWFGGLLGAVVARPIAASVCGDGLLPCRCFSAPILAAWYLFFL